MRTTNERWMRLGFGGGCHWCTEAVFQSLIGVREVRQGWIASRAPHDAFSEAVLVTFDERRLPLRDIVAVHIDSHAATSRHTLRGKYRSAIYVERLADLRRVESVLSAMRRSTGLPIVTQPLWLEAFRESPPERRDYFLTRPEGPFCQRWIVPRLRKIARSYPERVWHAFHVETDGAGKLEQEEGTCN